MQPDLVDAVCSALVPIPGVRHVTRGASTTDGLESLSAQVDVSSADAAIERLATFGIEPDDVTLWRVPGIQPLGWRAQTRSGESGGQVWAEIVGRADEHAELASSYLVFMVAAGIIAGIGVLTGSAVLIVGATAISPDLLPISATAIGLVERRWQLARRATRVLLIGLAASAAGVFAATALLRLFGSIPETLVLADTTIGEALTQLGPGSLMVAATAGVAGMMAFERPGGAAVGVAISVTTIPAAAHVGAALAMGRDDPMWGALVVLLSNVVLVATAVTVAASLPATQDLFDDDRADVSAAGLLWQIAVVTLVATVIPEELAFRGILLGAGRRAWGRRAAVVTSSALFGLWHITPTLSTAAGNQAVGDATGTTAGRVAVVLGAVAVTFVAGLVFCWLRLRSRSLLAPVLAHLSTNTIAFVAAWVLLRTSGH
ncbi:MAG: CPBP family glutamic-type intramembrane protease [Acidimicrobiales bacterium]|nr:CPBP family glutamic-type intramembrane protease [Acidimicrobiales bacterium]